MYYAIHTTMVYANLTNYSPDLFRELHKSLLIV